MIVKKEILKGYEEELAENARGMKTEDIKWMRQKIISSSSDLDFARDESEKESFVLLRLIRLIKKVKRSKTKDIRTFVEREIRRGAYNHEVSMIENKLIAMKQPDEKILRGLEKELGEIERKVEREDPDYLETIKGYCSRPRLWIRNKRTGREVEF